MQDEVKDVATAASTVVNNFIDKLASATGWIFLHDTPKRVALRNYIEELKKSNLPPLQKAALISRANKDIKEYANQCRIVNGAAQFLNDSSKPEQVEDDWLSQFLDKTRLVSNEEFQEIWSRILAEECNKPGSIPKSLMFILEKMSRDEAISFTRICSTTISVFNESVPYIPTIYNKELAQLGLSLDALIQLESIGLIKTSGNLSQFALTRDHSDNEKQFVSYFGNSFFLPDSMNRFTVGSVLFTKEGTALCNVVTTTEFAGFWEKTLLPGIKMAIQQHQQGSLKNEN